MCGVMGDGVTEGGVETIIKHGRCVYAWCCSTVEQICHGEVVAVSDD